MVPVLKSVAPLWSRLRHLRRPQMFLAHSHSPSADHATVGQRLAERVAAFVGSWWFLGGQACFLFLWLVYNTLQFSRHFDPPPYILLNLLLSFQAAFTGPVLLIAANVGAIRDHQQSDRIESLSRQNAQLTEQSAHLAERLLSMEQLLDQHVAQSLKAHSDELHSLGMLLREVHAVVCAQTPSDGSATVDAGGALMVDATAVSPGKDAAQTDARARSNSRRRGGTMRHPQPKPSES